MAVNKKIQHLITGLMVSLFLLGGIGSVKNYRHDKMPTPTQPVLETRLLRVEVSGAVVNPGLYVLDEGSRVFEAIAAAGGFKPDADSSELNLAKHLHNGQRLKIPYLGSNKLQLPTVTPFTLGKEMVESLPTGLGEEKDAEAVLVTPTPFNDKCAEPVTGRGVLIWPVDAHFLSGSDFSADHPGIDLAAGLGSPVYAADSGMISVAGTDDAGYGNLIEIDHGNGVSTVYAHLSMIEVKVCQNVYAGQRIGLAGNTGSADGTYLHFEVFQDSKNIDPWSMLP